MKNLQVTTNIINGYKIEYLDDYGIGYIYVPKSTKLKFKKIKKNIHDIKFKYPVVIDPTWKDPKGEYKFKLVVDLQPDGVANFYEYTNLSKYVKTLSMHDSFIDHEGEFINRGDEVWNIDSGQRVVLYDYYIDSKTKEAIYDVNMDTYESFYLGQPDCVPASKLTHIDPKRY